MLVKRFLRSRSGNFAMMFAISAPAVLAGVGLALDVANLMTAKSNLQNALDSAVLAASRLADASSAQTGGGKPLTREEIFDRYFKANIAGKNGLDDATATLEVDPGINYIRTSATAEADVPLTFGFFFGGNRHVTAASSAFESTAKLEVALVLDNTGSMGESNMKALREGATNLVTILQSAKTQHPQREIRAALVPFVTAVNINNPDFLKEEWIDKRLEIPAAENTSNGSNFDKLTNGKRPGHWKLFLGLNPKYPDTPDPRVDWKGCVEARPSPYNLNDTVPDPLVPATMFVPYFAPDEPGAQAKGQNADTSVFNNSYLRDPAKSSDSESTKIATQKSTSKYTAISKMTVQTDYLITATPPLTTGPNYACPTPLAPLTADLDKLKTEISKMTYWNGSGTNVSEGLAWGHRVLSPRFGTGDDFNSDGTTKVVVVFTDGENNVFGQKSNFNGSDYGSYGYLSSKRLDSNANRSKALTNVNTMTQGMCTTLKDQGVRVFTVVLGADTAANRELYSKCASTTANYYPTKNQEQLKEAFQNIAFAISQLYITN